MRRILSAILCVTFIFICTACALSEDTISDMNPDDENEQVVSEENEVAQDQEEDVPGHDLPDSETSSTPTPEMETYPVKISIETVFDTIDMWQIDGVFAQAIFNAEEMFEVRVFYVTEDNRLTMLCDFYPGDYPYCGAYILNDDTSIDHDYKQLVPYGNITKETDADGEPMIKSGSYYQNLPKGSWYFGDANMSNSFIIVVGDYEAAQNGTVPTN